MEKISTIKNKESNRTILRAFFLILIVTLATISTISAWDWDNIKTYDAQKREATITNALGMGGEIAKAKLISDDIVFVPVGYQKVAEFEIDLKSDDYNNPINQVRSYSVINTNIQLNKQFDYKYWVSTGNENIYDIKRNCISYNKNGTCIDWIDSEVIKEIKETGYWVDFNNQKINKGKIKIGLFTNVRKGDYVEWIPNLFGVDIPEWAIYGSIELKSHNVTETYSGGAASVSQLKGDLVNFTKNVNITGFEILDKTFYGGSLCYILNYTGDTAINKLKTGSISDNVCSITGGYEAIANNTYIIAVNDTGAGNGDLYQIYVTSFSYQNGSVTFGSGWGSAAGGDGKVTGLYMSNISYMEELSITDPLVTTTLISPSNNYQTASSSIIFDSSAICNNCNLTNTTLYVWNPDNSLKGINYSVITGMSNSTNLSLSGLDVENGYLWNVKYCGMNLTNDYNCSFFESNYTFNRTNYNINSINYNVTTYETKNENIGLNLTYDTSYWDSVFTTLNYNGTSYPVSSSGSGNNLMFNKQIEIPLLSGSSAENKSFYFTMAFANSTGVYYYNSSNYNQTVNPISLGDCAGSNTILSLNFTCYDEGDLSRILGFDFKGTIEYYTGSGNIKKNVTFNNLSIDEKTICINQNTSYYIDLNIEYNDNETGYNTRNYYTENFLINNQTQNISLLLLNSSDSTSFIIEVQNNNYVGLEGYLVEIQKYYYDTDSYEIVQVVKTDENGKSVAFLKTETVDYRFVVKNNGITYLTTEKQKVFPESSPYTITLVIGEVLEYPWEIFEDLNDLDYTLSYNNNTEVVTYIYSDSNSSFQQGRLSVYQFNNTGNNILVCNKISTSSSDSLSCDLTGNETGQYFANVYITRNSELYISTINFELGNEFIFGNTGLIIGWFIILTVTLIFIWNPTAMIIGHNIATIFVYMIGFINFGLTYIFAMIAISIIAIIFMKT